MNRTATVGGKVFHAAAAVAADAAAVPADNAAAISAVVAAAAAAAAVRLCQAICLFELSAPYFHFQRGRAC